MSLEASTMDIVQKRLSALQEIADTLTEKLRKRVDMEDAQNMNPQTVKHITGILKDLRDLQLTTADTQREGTTVTLLWEEELKKYSE